MRKSPKGHTYVDPRGRQNLDQATCWPGLRRSATTSQIPPRRCESTQHRRRPAIIWRIIRAVQRCLDWESHGNLNLDGIPDHKQIAWITAWVDSGWPADCCLLLICIRRTVSLTGPGVDRSLIRLLLPDLWLAHWVGAEGSAARTGPPVGWDTVAAHRLGAGGVVAVGGPGTCRTAVTR